MRPQEYAYPVYLGQCKAYYQPQIDNDWQVVGVEALLRTHAPNTDTTSAPYDFIAAAEADRTIGHVDRWMFIQAIDQYIEWERRGIAVPIWVNASRYSLEDPYYVKTCLKHLKQSGLPPGSINIEITEEGQLTQRMVESILAFREAGVKIALDDFGTKYSNIEAFEIILPDKLKVDQGFIRQGSDPDIGDITSNQEHQRAVRAIFNIANGAGTDIVVEGVEKHTQRDTIFSLADEFKYLGKVSCQGYLHAKPLLPDLFWAFASNAVSGYVPRG